jgi:hypothetical protein
LTALRLPGLHGALQGTHQHVRLLDVLPATCGELEVRAVRPECKKEKRKEIKKSVSLS